MGTDRLLGRDTAGTGQVEQITVNGAITFTGSGGITVTAANILSNLLTVDGSGSGLDADLLDGVSSAGFLQDFNFTDDAGTAGLAITEAETLTFAGVTTGIDTSGSGNTLTISYDATEAESSNEGVIDHDDLQGTLTLAGDVDGAHNANDLDEVAVEAELEAVLDAADLQGDITLTTDTAGDYVATVADGTGIDGTASGEGSTYTPSFDATEISSATWGAGSFTAFTFDAGATDPVITFGSGTITHTATAQINWDDELETRWFEEDAGGTNYKGFKAPASITANTTCTFEDDANFIPDNCVGDGTDDDVPESADVVLAGDVDGNFDSNDLDEAAVEAEIEPTLDTLANLTSIQGFTVTLADAGTNAFFGWDDVAGAYENLTTAEAEAIMEPLIDTLANLTSIQGVSFTFGAYAATLLNNADEAAFKAAVNLEIGTDVQAWDAELDALSSAAFSRATASTASFLRLLEDTDNGTNYIELIAPASIGTNRQCILQDSGPPIPDSCVGDGTDDTGAGGGDALRVEDGDNTGAFTAATDPDFDDGGDINFVLDTGATPDTIQGEIRADAVGPTELANAGDYDLTGTLTLDADALQLDDTNASHQLILTPGSDLTADRVLTLTTGDAARTLTLSANATLNDADYGDLTTSSSFTAWNIDADLSIDSTADAVNGVLWTFEHSDPTPDAGDDPFEIAINAGDDQEQVALFHLELVDDATTTEDTRWDFYNDVAGTLAKQFSICDGVIIGTGTTCPGAGVMSSANGVVIGHTVLLNTYDNVTSGAPVFQLQGTTGAGSGMAVTRYSDDTSSSHLISAKSRGATIDSHTIVQDGDTVGAFDFEGSDGTDFESLGAIAVQVDGTPGDNDMPGRIVFRTTPDGAHAGTAKMTIKNDGGVIIGDGTTSPGAEDLSLEGGDIEFGNAGTAGTNTTLSYAAAGELNLEGVRLEKAGVQQSWVDAAACTPNATSGAGYSTGDSGSNDLTVIMANFDAGATEERIDCKIPLPKRYAGGTLSFIPISFCSSCSASQTIQFEFACVFIRHDDTLNAAVGTAQSSSVTVTAAGDNQTGAATNAVTCAGTHGDQAYIHLRVSRDTSVDNATGDASLLGFFMEWTSDLTNDD